MVTYDLVREEMRLLCLALSAVKTICKIAPLRQHFMRADSVC